MINPAFPEQKVKIGKQVAPEDRKKLIKFLEQRLDIFAWQVEDMCGIDEEVVVHELNVNPEFTPIQQRPRYLAKEKE